MELLIFFVVMAVSLFWIGCHYASKTDIADINSKKTNLNNRRK